MAEPSNQLPRLEQKLAEMTERRLSKSPTIMTIPEWRSLKFERTFWLQAPSGTGKNWTGSQATIPAFDLDWIGKEKDGKWITDVAKFKAEIKNSDGPMLVVGTSDNTLELQREVDSDEWDVGFLLPQYHLFLEMQAAKALDGEKGGVNPEWVEHWRNKSKLTRSEWAKYFSDKYSELLNRLQGSRNLQNIYIVLNAHNGKKVTHGWFQDSSKPQNSKVS